MNEDAAAFSCGVASVSFSLSCEQPAQQAQDQQNDAHAAPVLELEINA
jgi:hypothetical protein